MPPEQPQLNSSSYDFILHTEQPELQKSWWDRLNKTKFVLLIVIMVSLLTAGAVIAAKVQAAQDKTQQGRLVSIAQQQTEIRRIAAIGIDKAESAESQARAQAIKDSMDRALSATLQLLKSRNNTPSRDELSSTRNGKSDDTLNKALTYQNFDTTFEKLIDNELVDYQRALLAAQDAGNDHEKSVLGNDYNEANSILGLVDET